MKTHITALLDKSGSMEHLQREVITGINEFLADQRSAGGEDTLVTILLFDTEVTVPVIAEKLADVCDLDETRYRPSGMTALNDALVRAIRSTEGRLEEGDRALVLVVTDGHENSSRETTKQQVVALIQQMESRGNWTFTYMSADPNGFADAQSYGIPKGNVAQFVADSAGTSDAFLSMSRSTKAYARSASLSAASFYSGDEGGDKKRHPLDTPPRLVKPRLTRPAGQRPTQRPKAETTWTK